MNITDMIISTILKKGVLYEARNCDLEFNIPIEHEGDDGESKENEIRIRFKAEHMTLRIEKQ